MWLNWANWNEAQWDREQCLEPTRPILTYFWGSKRPGQIRKRSWSNLRRKKRSLSLSWCPFRTYKNERTRHRWTNLHRGTCTCRQDPRIIDSHQRVRAEIEWDSSAGTTRLEHPAHWKAAIKDGCPWWRLHWHAVANKRARVRLGKLYKQVWTIDCRNQEFEE